MASRNPLAALPSGVRQLVFQRLSTTTPARPSIPLRSLLPTARNHATSAATPPPNYTSSVNETEVSHFNALASSWWDPHGSSRLLHLMNPLRHDFIRHCKSTETITKTPPGQQNQQTYLDIGCGAGIFAESAARLSSTASVTGLDPTPNAIAVAQQHARQDPLLLQPGRLNYRNHALEELPPGFPQVDILTLFEVIEHIQQPSPFLSACLERVKPGGWLVGSTIARTATSWFTTKFMAEEVLRMVPRGTHEWGQYIQPGEMRGWAEKAEGVEEGSWQVRGVVYVPGLGWKVVEGSEGWGNYFFAMRKRM